VQSYPDVRDTFGLRRVSPGGGQSGTGANTGINVNITDVDWSVEQTSHQYSEISRGIGKGREQQYSDGDSVHFSERLSLSSETPQLDDVSENGENSSALSSSSFHGVGMPVSPDNIISGLKHNLHHNMSKTKIDSGSNNNAVIAAAGSNGTVVVWNASRLCSPNEIEDAVSQPANSTAEGRNWYKQHNAVSASSMAYQPEAILSEHTRAVNRLVFNPNPRCSGLLLTASQDATVKLWERRIVSGPSQSYAHEVGKEKGRGSTSYSSLQKQRSRNLRGLTSWLGLSTPSSSQSEPESAPPMRFQPSWRCVATFRPKSGPVRDVKWSPFLENVFGMVTDSGYLIIYDIRVRVRPWISFIAHAEEATSLDWHSTRPYIIATGGGRDRSVKVWDIENGMVGEVDDMGSVGSLNNAKHNSNSCRSEESGNSSVSGASSAPVPSQIGTGTSIAGGTSIGHSNIVQSGPCLMMDNSSHSPPGTNHMTSRSSLSSLSIKRTSSTGRIQSNSMSSGRHQSSPRKLPAIHLHTLSVARPVTRILWRPPTICDVFSSNEQSILDPHDSMICVATAPISAYAGDSGLIGLWSYHRPFMPLSIVEGHNEGPVNDFVWYDTPASAENPNGIDIDKTRKVVLNRHYSQVTRRSIHSRKERDTPKRKVLGYPRTVMDHAAQSGWGSLPMPSVSYKHSEKSIGPGENKYDRNNSSIVDTNGKNRVSNGQSLGLWQHLISVGKDGNCLIESLARGLRPIEQVPSSVLAFSHSPALQFDTGSLQLVSVHQNVPSGEENDFALTGLCCNVKAPGIFEEVAPKKFREVNTADKKCFSAKVEIQKEPSHTPKLVFSLLDYNRNTTSQSVSDDSSQSRANPIAPELLNIAYFAKNYDLRRNQRLSTKTALCASNSKIAQLRSGCGDLARMWKILETLLSGSGFEELSSTESIPLTRTALGSVLWSTVCSLLLERAERADVQTCVAICEVFEILGPGESRDGELCSFIVSKSNEAEQCEMDIELVREWYLSYIDILHRKCLFSEATSLIRTCRDPVVAALNQNSTTIHESCPSCGKQLQGVTTIVDDIATNNGDFGGGNSNKSLILTTQRACKNCRRRIGQCFLCHLPVKDLFVWCPGCGHGGHLACAQEWFGGVDSYGEPSMRPQEFCPTGCGHKCNFSKKMWNSPSKRHSLSSTSQMAIA